MLPLQSKGHSWKQKPETALVLQRCLWGLAEPPASPRPQSGFIHLPMCSSTLHQDSQHFLFGGGRLPLAMLCQLCTIPSVLSPSLRQPHFATLLPEGLLEREQLVGGRQLNGWPCVGCAETDWSTQCGRLSSFTSSAVVKEKPSKTE